MLEKLTHIDLSDLPLRNWFLSILFVLNKSCYFWVPGYWIGFIDWVLASSWLHLNLRFRQNEFTWWIDKNGILNLSEVNYWHPTNLMSLSQFSLFDFVKQLKQKFQNQNCFYCCFLSSFLQNFFLCQDRWGVDTVMCLHTCRSEG